MWFDWVTFLSKFAISTSSVQQSNGGTSSLSTTDSSGGSGNNGGDDYQRYMKYTHVSMISPKQRYFIPSTEMDKFWQLYGTIYLGAHTLGMLEMSPMTLPVLVDMDYKVEKTDMTNVSSRLFTSDYIEKIVHIYQKVLQEHFDIPCENNLLCFVMEKAPYLTQRNGRCYVKHGFHLHFPKVFLKRWIQEQELIPRVKMEFKRLYEGKDGFLPLDQTLDKSYCRGNGGPWLLYGSRKDVDMDPYLISCVYSGHGICYKDDWPRFLYQEGYSIFDTQQQKIEWDLHSLDFHLPRILSLFVSGRTEYLSDLRSDAIPLHMILGQSQVVQSSHQLNHQLDRQQRCQRISGGNSSMSVKPATLFGQVSMEEKQEQDGGVNVDMIQDLVSLLKEERARERNDWMQIGWILYSIFEGGQQGLDIWMTFSQQCPELYEERTCRYEWSKMKKKAITIGSLKYLAKQDHPEGYQELMKKYMQPYIDESLKLNGTHNDIAKALFEKYEGEFVCASIKEKVWYQFKNPIWVSVEEGVSLRSKISSEVVAQYQQVAQQLLTQFATCHDKDSQKHLQNKVNNVMKIISQLKSAPFKTNIMKEATEVFYQSGFLRKLDSNSLIFSFENGVMDLETFEFRWGRPEDYQSVRAPLQYRTDYHSSHPDVEAIRDFFIKIFPDKSVREYFLDISCEVFLGGNSRKIVQFWSGDGNNGKSVTQELFEKMLGPYSIKLPTSLITGKRTQSSSACPELARAGNGVRLAMLQEPDRKDILNLGILKELSGNDTFFARGLYQPGTEIKPMFKLVLVCNEPPKVPYNDKATWNRIRVIPFESMFTDDAPATWEEQLLHKRFPKDIRFEEKIPHMVEALAWFLMDRLRSRPKEYIIHEPEKVLLATANYQRRNDIYRQFVDEIVKKDCSDDKTVSLNELYFMFKDWYRENIPGSFAPIKAEFKDTLQKMWGDADGVRGRGDFYWKGKSIHMESSLTDRNDVIENGPLSVPPMPTSPSTSSFDPSDSSTFY